jgi:hypothetical protein
MTRSSYRRAAPFGLILAHRLDHFVQGDAHMARRILVTLVAIFALFSLGTVGALGVGREVHPSGQVRYHAPKGQANPHKPGSNPNLINHGGPILNSTVVKAVYWGTSWAGYTGDKISGLGSFYAGSNGSNYIGTNTEYTGPGGTTISRSVSYQGSTVDLTAAGSRAPSTSAVFDVVARNITNPVPNGYYPVYSDIRRGSAGYCAWHSWGTINNVAVQFAFFFNLDADSGCDPGDTNNTHSQGLEALANVSGHELSEAITDPHLNAWYDSKGAENSDKCAWTFSGLVHLGSSGDWKVQGNWSNAAYNAKTGYALGGCIQGN